MSQRACIIMSTHQSLKSESNDLYLILILISAHGFQLDVFFHHLQNEEKPGSDLCSISTQLQAPVVFYSIPASRSPSAKESSASGSPAAEAWRLLLLVPFSVASLAILHLPASAQLMPCPGRGSRFRSTSFLKDDTRQGCIDSEQDGDDRGRPDQA